MHFLTCDRCARQTPDGNFCTHCGLVLQSHEEPEVADRSWQPRAEEFGVRVRGDQFGRLFPTGLEIDASQLGLQFEGGRLVHVLRPGDQQTAGLLSKLRQWLSGRTCSFVLIRSGDFRLLVEGELRSGDGDRLQFSCPLAVRLSDHAVFFQQFMQNSSVILERDLVKVLAATVRRQLAATVAGCSSTELKRPDPELLQRLADEIEAAVAADVQRLGLQVAWVSPPEISSEDYERFDEERSRLLHDLRDRRLRQSYQERLDEIEIRRFRGAQLLSDAKLKHQIAEAEQQDEYGQLIQQLQHKAQLKGLNLREQMEQAVDAYKARRRDVQWQQQDSVGLREHMLAALNVERSRELARVRYELRSESLKQQHELDELSAERERQVLERDLVAELKRAELSRSAELSGRVAEARTQAEIEQIVEGSALKITEARDKAKIERLKNLSRLQQEHLTGLLDLKERRQTQKQQDAKFHWELAESGKDSEHRRQQESLDKQQQRRAAELEALKTAPELLQLMSLAELAAQSPLMAGTFADAMRLQMSKGLTVEQLQVLAAERSPAVATMLTERFGLEQRRASESAANSQRDLQIEGLERIINELRRNQELSEQRAKEFEDRLERVGLHGQQMLRDVMVALRSGPAASGAEASSGPREPVTEQLMRMLLDEVRELRAKSR